MVGMVIGIVVNGPQSFACVCGAVCIILPLALVLFCLILALAHAIGHVGLGPIFNRPPLYAVLILGMAIILPLDLALMLLFGRKHRVVKSWDLEKYSGDDLARPRLALAPGGVYVINDTSGCRETVIQRYDRDGRYVKSLNAYEYLYEAIGDDDYREHAIDGDHEFHDIDVSPSGNLLVLASMRPADMPDDELSGYSGYYTGPMDTVILNIGRDDAFVGLIRVSRGSLGGDPKEIVAGDDDIYLSGGGQIYRLGYDGKVLARYDAREGGAAGGTAGLSICVAGEHVIAAEGLTREVIFMTKELRPVRQWKAGFLDKRDGFIHGIGADKDLNVYVLPSTWSKLSEYSKDGTFKDRSGNLLLGKKGMDPADIAVDKNGDVYVLNTLFSNGVTVLRRRKFIP